MSAKPVAVGLWRFSYEQNLPWGHLMNGKSGVFSGVSGCLLVLASANVFAAQGAAVADEGLTLEEVTVTAERVERDIQKQPQFITVKTGAELKEEGKIRVEDVLQGVAGLTVEPTSNGQDTMIYFRGVSNAAAGVSIVVDGVSQAVGTQSRGNVYRATTLDVSQVAITRGVQNGAGTTALGGSVSLVTNKPVFENQVAGSVTTGSFKTQNTEGMVNLAISSNQAVRLAFNTERRDAYASSGLGEVNNRAARFRYRWKPTDSVDVNATFEESRITGASNSASSNLYTGQWMTVPGGGVFNYTNPYSGVTTAWGQQISGKQFYYTGNVLASFAANNSATTTVGSGTLTASATLKGPDGNPLTSTNQYFYPAPACVANTSFLPVAGTQAQIFSTSPSAANPAQTVYASLDAAKAAAMTALGNMGPASFMFGCPFNMMAIRNGVDWYNRSNPWDDGLTYGSMLNQPNNQALVRQGNISIQWSTSQGDVTVQPSFIYNTGRMVLSPVAGMGGTGYTANNQSGTTAYKLDASFTSKMLGKFQYILGLNGAMVPAQPDGGVGGPSSYVNTAPVTAWATKNDALSTAPVAPAVAVTGVAANGGLMTPWNTTCYFALPAVNASGVVQATSRGVTNNNACIGSVYNAGTTNNSMALTTQLSYTLGDKLHMSGTARYERFSNQTRNSGILFLTDTDGTSYVNVVPKSTLATATATNPNSPYALPYRMNLTANDMQALVDAYPTLDTSFGAATWTLNLQYDVTPAMIAYARMGTGVSAAMTDDSSLRPQTQVIVSLPDAKVPTFGGNADPAAIALAGTPYQVSVLAPSRDSQLRRGDQTRQIAYGLKSRWFDNRLQVNVEGFYNLYTNRSVSFITGLFPTDIYNAQSNPLASQLCTQNAPTAANPFVIALDSAGTASARGGSCFNIYQPTTSGGTGAPWTGRMVSRGADLDITWTPTTNDRLDIATEVLNTVYMGSEALPTVSVDSLRPYVIGTGVNDAVLNYYAQIFNAFTVGVPGKQLANAPKLTANATYQHRFALENGWRITPRVQMNYTSAKFISSGGGGVPQTDGSSILDSNWAIDNGRRLPTVVPTNRIWNASINFQAPNSKWSVNAFINNVRNQAVMAFASGLTSIDYGSRQTGDLQKVVTGGNLTLNAPRVVGVTVSAQL